MVWRLFATKLERAETPEADRPTQWRAFSLLGVLARGGFASRLPELLPGISRAQPLAISRASGRTANDTRRLGSCDGSESRLAESGVGGVAEVYLVEGVEQFPPELDPEALPDRNFLQG